MASKRRQLTVKRHRDRYRKRRVEQHRRSQKLPSYYDKVNGLSHSSLTLKAYEALRAHLKYHGNILNKDHAEALFNLVRAFTAMSQGKLKGRWGFGLPTGAGKTSAIIAWVSTLCKLKHNHIAVAVSASKVEALCDLKRDLIDSGVSEDRIGLIHSYKFDKEAQTAAKEARKTDSKVDVHEVPQGYASEPSEGEDRQILLVTHQRIRGGKDLKRFNTYQGRQRDLVIWDESLMVSDSIGLTVRDLRAERKYLEGLDREQDTSLVDYLGRCLSVITDELDKLESTAESRSGVIHLPFASIAEVATFRSSLADARYSLSSIRHLLDITGGKVKVTSTGTGGFIHYEISVPPELDTIAVLDASYPIRHLMRCDPTIKDAETEGVEEGFIRKLSCPFSQIKRFDDVTICQLPKGGGRTTLSRQFSKRKPEERKASKEVVEVIKAIPDDEAILIFVFKDRSSGGMGFRGTLLKDLEQAGVDTDAFITVEEGGKEVERRRIAMRTWGEETSTNRFGYCTNVILCGVLQRSLNDLEGAWHGQSDTNLEGDIGAKELLALRNSEAAHAIYQAISRGSCRKMTEGKANPMRAWIIFPSTSIQDSLGRAMPGVIFTRWKSCFQDSTSRPVHQAARAIENCLKAIPTALMKLSLRQLKKESGLGEKFSDSTFKRARQLALDEVKDSWVLDQRSVVRVSATK